MIEEGKTAPAFSLLSDTGAEVSLKDFKGQSVVLYFYPKDSTPGCTQEGCDFRDSIARFKKSGTVVLGISKDSVQSHAKFKAQFSFPFPLLSDSEGVVCDAYGVWKEKSLYGRKYMGLDRTTVVIGLDGKISKIFSKVKVKGHVEQVLELLKK